ncbi:hypothetical protein V2G26_000825 [Clonostachys chloroleuca]
MHESLPSNKIYRRGGAFPAKLFHRRLADLINNHGIHRFPSLEPILQRLAGTRKRLRARAFFTQRLSLVALWAPERNSNQKRWNVISPAWASGFLVLTEVDIKPTCRPTIL